MPFEIDLSDKVVIITGVSSGIGAGIAKMFAKTNASIAGCALENKEEESVRSFCDMVRKESGKDPLYFQGDLTDNRVVINFVDTVYERFGNIDILASNAGANFFKGVSNCSDTDWEKNIRLNLASHWNISRACKRYLEESGSGTIIINSSCHAFNTITGSFPYNIAKTALKALVQSITIEWGPLIRCVGVAPGFIETKLAEDWFNSFPDPEFERRRTKDAYPLKRLGTPEEIGAWFVFLSSKYAGFTGGRTYLIDGGRSAVMYPPDQPTVANWIFSSIAAASLRC